MAGELLFAAYQAAQSNQVTNGHLLAEWMAVSFRSRHREWSCERAFATDMRCDLFYKVEAKNSLETAKSARRETSICAGATSGTKPDLLFCFCARSPAV